MPKIDRIKAEISFHEKMFFAALAVVMALVGWAAEHYLTTSFWILRTIGDRPLFNVFNIKINTSHLFKRCYI